jgi:hypothetical protein
MERVAGKEHRPAVAEDDHDRREKSHEIKIHGQEWGHQGGGLLRESPSTAPIVIGPFLVPGTALIGRAGALP